MQCTTATIFGERSSSEGRVLRLWVFVRNIDRRIILCCSGRGTLRVKRLYLLQAAIYLLAGLVPNVGLLWQLDS
jgi:hypothetical protein